MLVFKTSSVTIFLRCGVCVWAVLIVVIFYSLFAHELTPVRAVATDPSLVERLKFSKERVSKGSFAERQRWHIKMYVHPECPCTTSSLRMLDELLQVTRWGGEAEIVISTNDTDDWFQSTNAQLAHRVRNTSVRCDSRCYEAIRDHALGSGTMIIQDENDEIVFWGGITTGRNCIEPGPSFEAARELLMHHVKCDSVYPVFGCRLY